MLRKSCQIVVIALVLMAVLTPVMQLDSWDQFPVSSDDIELAVTLCLCILGMGLVFVRILRLAPELLQGQFQLPSLSTPVSIIGSANRTSSIKFRSDIPLRI